MNKNKILSLLGFAQKAGKVISGENTVHIFLKRKNTKIHLVLLAEDTSQESKKKFTNKLQNKNIKYRIFGTKEQLGRSIGKNSRAILGITDSGLAQKILDLLEEEEP
ncbi:MAG: hypothetical protein PWQ96_591 [Clostridia bacterium]|jgi:ribosomal protein L7Ae-like RNA K-turn-binding protein|nr:hypothetical protein [Clostridia bacterium]